jgi:V/A-type H+-transporting ATPase subunit K
MSVPTAANMPLPVCLWRLRGISAPAQGRFAAATVNLLAKRPDEWFKGIILARVVEFYAILSLLASFMMINSI